MPKFLSLKPAGGKQWSARFHLVLNIALPIVLLMLVRAGLYEVSIVVALFSKWRVFTVRWHHLNTNLRSNSTDIIVKIGTLLFMIQYDGDTWIQLGWTAWYILWLTVIKPKSDKVYMGIQALAGQLIGLSALFLFSDRLPEPILLLGVWGIAASAARHFLISYEEPWARAISHMWALFVTQLAWVLNNWLLVYVAIPQIAIIVTALSYVMASIYDAYMNDKLRAAFVRQQVIMTTIFLLILIIFADWRGEI